ncbi:MAG: type II 3-dehydroquinate dehydratase [Actinobacteria bacterium]|nr:type II 3-dehydroquinate dehydratase [Actinomycetota bacterium]
MKKIIIINGPNLNLLGFREKEIYGDESFEDMYKELKKLAQDKEVELLYFQSNDEGEILDRIHQCIGEVDLIIINPGALTHYSYSLHDAILAVKIPVIEVHISNIFKREDWRRKSVVSPAVLGVISGFGLESYRLALLYALDYIKGCKK